MTNSHARLSAESADEAQPFFSRRLSSRSTASRINAARDSLSSKTRSIRSSVPPIRRAGICSSLICLRPMPGVIDDITYCYKGQNKRYHLFTRLRYLISSITSARSKQMTYQIATNEVGSIYVVLASEGRIVRIVRKCDDRADAAQLLRDLSGWRL